MSLTLRINLVLTVLLLFAFYIAAIVSGNNIQKVILEQVNKSSDAALSLISSILTNQKLDDKSKRQLIVHVSSLIDTQLLQVDYYGVDGQTIFTANAPSDRSKQQAPAWFSKLISIDTPPRYQIFLPTTPNSRVQLGIDPNDKIDEAWENTKPLLLLALLFAAFCYLLVFLSVKSALRPVISIVNGLESIKKGNYEARIPRFRSPELSDISEKINGVAETLETAKNLEQTMAKQAVQALEKERQYLARELHDELGQSISAIKAIAVSSGCDENNTHISSKQAIEDLCDHVYGVVNTLMRRLRPVVLEELGLVVALRQMIDDWNDKNSEVFCKLSIRGDFEQLSDEASIHLYRVVQEGLTNISKHSNATEVDIKLIHQADTGISLTIRDNGSITTIDSSDSRYGLRGIRERID
ncbi:MAG: hypothetical protein KDJ38_00990, partial [Gammaproteobacteria bacterium]|nr:hypothetical protein [Gammaproteobacteria bacterium]